VVPVGDLQEYRVGETSKSHFRQLGPLKITLNSSFLRIDSLTCQYKSSQLEAPKPVRAA
jgi:hypothetical protein